MCFGLTACPEINIANSVGVIEAIKGCKSVKILGLSSYRSLGDRGQGIQKLSHLLIKMISTSQDRLHAILYGFTKYPPTTDISALLVDLKRSQADENSRLQLDSSFVSVLEDMIEKINSGDAENIDPVQGCPKNTIEKLKSMQCIMYPGEVFQFSISDETHVCITNQAQRDNVRCQMCIET